MNNAVWFYPKPELLQEKAIQKFLNWSQEHGIKKVIVHFANRNLWPDPVVDEALQQFLNVVAAAGLEVHGMINTLTSPAETLRKGDYRHLFAVDAHGQSSLVEPAGGHRFLLDPNQPLVAQIVEETVRNLLQTYPILTGLQLDFIRYYHFHSILDLDSTHVGHNLNLFQAPELTLQANGNKATYYLRKEDIQFNDPPIGGPERYEHQYSYCFCSKCLADLEAEAGIILPWSEGIPATATYILNHHRKAWSDFRAKIITGFVRRLRRFVGEKQLSATIWYQSPYSGRLTGRELDASSVYRDFAQDWALWVEEGLVDFLCPMNYWLDPEDFAAVTAHQTQTTKKRIPLYAGILYDPQFRLCGESLEVYQQAAQQSQATGICFFSYNSWQGIGERT